MYRDSHYGLMLKGSRAGKTGNPYIPPTYTKKLNKFTKTLPRRKKTRVGVRSISIRRLLRRLDIDPSSLAICDQRWDSLNTVNDHHVRNYFYNSITAIPPTPLKKIQIFFAPGRNGGRLRHVRNDLEKMFLVV